MSEPQSKRQKTSVTYELPYHPGFPGRAEYARLVFEATGTTYDSHNSPKDRLNTAIAICNPERDWDEHGNPPAFAPPLLKVTEGDTEFVISQTTNILMYLGQKLGLAGSEENHRYYINGLALTALDLCAEAHNVHHPIGGNLYYEDQKDAALESAKHFREMRIPKFFGYFERVLKGNEEKGAGKYLIGSSLTYADTTVWQSIDGLKFAFPKEMEAVQKDYPVLFEFYESLKREQWLADYLKSDRRVAYSNGIYRHYPELDRQ